MHEHVANAPAIGIVHMHERAVDPSPLGVGGPGGLSAGHRHQLRHPYAVGMHLINRQRHA